MRYRTYSISKLFIIYFVKGQELKARRKKLSLSQGGLANWLAVTENKLKNWENGRTPIPDVIEQRLGRIEAKLMKSKRINSSVSNFK